MVATDRIVNEIEQFYKSYIDGFNREDIDLFLQSFDLPYVVLSGEQGVTCVRRRSRQAAFLYADDEWDPGAWMGALGNR